LSDVVNFTNFKKYSYKSKLSDFYYSKLVDKANKKQFGRKVKPKNLLVNLLNLADDNLIENVIKKSQEDSLSHSDKRELFLKKHMEKFSGSKEDFEEKMMELMSGFLSQNLT